MNATATAIGKPTIRIASPSASETPVTTTVNASVPVASPSSKYSVSRQQSRVKGLRMTVCITGLSIVLARPFRNPAARPLGAVDIHSTSTDRLIGGSSPAQRISNRPGDVRGGLLLDHDTVRNSIQEKQRNVGHRSPPRGRRAAAGERTARGASRRHTDADVLPAIEAGATGYLLKDTPREELLRAVRSPREDALSERELEVLRLIAGGSSNRDAAAELNISEATVKTHLLHIYTKLGVSDRAAAVAEAFNRGLLTPRER